jgi:hypothetical protein
MCEVGSGDGQDQKGRSLHATSVAGRLEGRVLRLAVGVLLVGRYVVMSSAVVKPSRMSQV